MPGPVPSPVVPAAAMAELVTQPLYDSDTCATAATSVTLFDGTNVTGNRLLSNLDQAGSLPHPKFFRIGGFRQVLDANIIVSADLAAVANQNEDVVRFLFGSYFIFSIGSLKPYLECPAFWIPGGVGPVLRSGNTTAYTQANGLEQHSNFVKLRHWLALPPLQSFRAQWTFPTAVTLNNTQRVWLFLEGEFGREVM